MYTLIRNSLAGARAQLALTIVPLTVIRQLEKIILQRKSKTRSDRRPFIDYKHSI